MIKKALISIVVVLASMVVIAPSIATQREYSGAVYVMTNDPEDNEIAVYSRNANGLLVFEEYYSTEGLGSGGDGVDPLASQESLILSPNKRWLIAVNAGSNNISVFRIRHDLLYVLNAGADSSGPKITGFRLSHRGELIPLAGSTRELEPGGFHQVGFDPQGDVLVITEGDPAGANRIHVFSVNKRGLPGPEAVISPSNGVVPFGFIFDHRDHLVVSEAGSGAVSSYKILRNNSLRVISPSVANEQTATCWIAANRKGFVYTANTGSDTITAYKVRSGKGRVVLLDQTAGSGNKPIDMTTAGNGRFLYVLNAFDGTVGMFRIKSDGSLNNLGTIGGLPNPYAQGIVGY
jgi:6-phosphogluconolactonase